MRVELGPIGSWRHDLTYCLHTTAGVLLGVHRLPPLEVLGAYWGFHHLPGPVPREEYYFPLHQSTLFSSLAPYHPVTSCWHEPADAEQGWADVRAAVASGRPVAVAVDNFHLPFRPAYGDVHTNHLLAVYGFDDALGEALVADPVPPAYQGPIPIAALTAARDSANPIRHDRDLFYTANPIGNRWLDIEVGEGVPAFDASTVDAVLAANLRGFGDCGPAGAQHGLAGLRAYLDGAVGRFAVDPGLVDELFIVGEPAMGVAGLHADWLALAAGRLGMQPLVRPARLVERVAHHWAALRIAAASARHDRASAVPGLRRRVSLLLQDTELALDGLSAARRSA